MFRLLAAGAILSSAIATFGPSAAQTSGDVYPSKPITIVYPAAAGGSGDPLVRTFAEQASKILGQTIVVENKPGGNFTIGARAVLTAPPDGYTLLMGIPGHVNMKSFMDLPYDPIKNFTPIAKLTSSNYYFVVSDKFPAKTFREFVDYAKTHHVTHGTLAVGATGHVFAERLNALQGTKLVSAPYRSDGAIVNDMLGGQIDACFCSLPPALQHVKAGKLRVLATTAPSRGEPLTDAPTFRELGYVGSQFNYSTWLGLLGPEKLPADRVKKIADAFQTVMQLPVIVSYLQNFGTAPDFMGPSEFQPFLVKTFGEWDADVKKSNSKIQ
jgi:tripartite-type tricarboxylate transporter receptor subunit TctC